MHIWRLLLCAGATLMMDHALGNGADKAVDPVQDRVQRKKVEAQRLQRRGAAGELVSAKALEKLNLTKEQKEKFDKINQEFQEKQKELQARMQEAIKNRDHNKLVEAAQAKQKLRPDYLTPLEGVLNDAQKKDLEEISREGSHGRLNIGGGPFRPGGTVPGQLLPPQLQERLKLTDEQKKKLVDLQKDAENKVQDLLTEEQRKLLKDMKQPARRKRPQESHLEKDDTRGRIVAQRPLRRDSIRKADDSDPIFT
jgi:hypothetical protein